MLVVYTREVYRCNVQWTYSVLLISGAFVIVLRVQFTARIVSLMIMSDAGPIVDLSRLR